MLKDEDAGVVPLPLCEEGERRVVVISGVVIIIAVGAVAPNDARGQSTG